MEITDVIKLTKKDMFFLEINPNQENQTLRALFLPGRGQPF